MYCRICGNILPGNCRCEHDGMPEPVGSCLKEIIPSVFSSSNCRCNETAGWMDRLGIKGCLKNKPAIIERIVAHSSRRKILAVVPVKMRRTVVETWLDQAIEAARKIARDRRDSMQ